MKVVAMVHKQEKQIMTREITKVAVLGSGVMGSAIAAHLANAGIPSYLLDIVPKELTPEETAKGLSLASPAVRNRIVNAGLDSAKKARPAAFYSSDFARLITIGNFDDNLAWLKDVDWIIEVVVERLDIKQSLLKRVDTIRKPGTIVSSNTSGIPINQIKEGLSEDFRKHFLGTHFFNPPRYMKLLEIIPTAETLPDVVGTMASFGERTLGKGIVYCKDRPNFIANRIGVFAMMEAMRTMLEGNFTIEEVDQMTGPATGKPKSATFRTGDIVGIDTLVHVANNLYEAVPDDEMRQMFVVPEFIKKLVENKMLGDKTKQGFYKKVKGEGKNILTLDYTTLQYRERQKGKFASIEAGKNIESLTERLKMLTYANDRAGEFIWKTTGAILLYSANRIPEISDDIVNVDKAMRWGFNWQLGPFEMWDAIGVEASVKKMRAEGKTIPPMVEKLLASGEKSFYEKSNGVTYYFDVKSGKHVAAEEKTGLVLLPSYRDRNRLIKKNSGASLIDIGDGVACLEFHSKMNAIGEDILSMTSFAVQEVGKNFEGMVVGNEGDNFSVGANIMLMLMSAQEGDWDELDMMARAFQKATQSLKFSPKPVVAAPFGMTLGGGCEFALGADKIRTAAELYMGLVEVGVGIIPAGGGCKEMLVRALDGVPKDSDADLFPFVKRVFETIGMAKVSTSAVEAKEIGFLRKSDGITMNKDYLIADAKATVLAMVKEGYKQPMSRTDIPVLGESALATLKMGMYLMKSAGRISEYDMHVGTKLAYILCGGDLSAKSLVSEQYILDLEREAFLSLAAERKTQERLAYMLKNGKALRN
jgi:3-hydroxyacyl-CoA dehydrogenase